MAPQKVHPETRICPVCSTSFEVGGRGRRPRKAIYCSIPCSAIGRPQPTHHPGSHAPRPRKNKDTLHNEEWLRARYIDERLSMDAIARSLSCSVPSVKWALAKFGIQSRTNSESHKGQPATEWTPEMREAMAAKRRGGANPMHGRSNVRQHPGWDPDPRVRRIRAKRLSKYGLAALAYDAMVEAQGGLCLTCGRPERKKRADGTMFTLSVDHDHATGKIRGLLCNDCNAALGMIGDNVATLRSMIAYLERHVT